MFRPATAGRRPGYALSDPGHEYIPDVTECWLGPLADEWHLRLSRATLTERDNLYRHKSPDGRTDLLPHVELKRYRPVHAAVFHASKSFNAWLVEQAPQVRQRAKAVFARCAAEIFEQEIALDLRARTQKDGRGSVAVKTIAVAFVHETNAAGHYHLHVHLEIHNVGRSADGKYRAVDNKPLYRDQRLYSMAFQVKVMNAVYREFGLETRPGPKGLSIKGYEALRDVKTPRQEQIEARLDELNLAPTPKARARASRDTHARRDPKLTVAEALRRSVAWLKAKGLAHLRAVVAKVKETSILREERLAERSIRKAVRVVSGAGRNVTYREFCMLARFEAGVRRVSAPHFERELAAIKNRPGRYGMSAVAPGLLTTDRIERSRAKWGRAVSAQALAWAKPPRASAVRAARVKNAGLPVEEVATAVSAMRKRVHVAEGLSPGHKVMHDAYRADRRRRVFVVSGEGSAAQLRRVVGSPVQDADAFATRLETTPLWDTFLELRRHRWRSLDHVGRLTKQIRQPAERLTRRDLVILDARGTSQHAVAKIVACARKAKASVVVITNLGVIEQHRPLDRGPSRDK